MLLRYTGSTGGGALITAALIYSMQAMVTGHDSGSPATRWIDISVPMHEVVDPPRPEPRKPPPKPEPREALPDLSVTSTTVTEHPTGGHTLLPGRPTPGQLPGRRTGHGGPDGPGLTTWSTDSSLVAMAQVQPIYPRRALTLGLEGRVVVEFTVTAAGTVADASVIAASDPVFETAALAAVARFRYRPRRVDGVAVAVPGVRTEFSFRLDN